MTYIVAMSLNERSSCLKCKCHWLQLLTIGKLLQADTDASHWNDIRSAVKAAIVDYR